MSIEKMLEGELIPDSWGKISSTLLTGIGLIDNPKLQRTVVIGTAAVSVAKAGLDWWKSHRPETSYSIRIYETDLLYEKVQAWIVSTMDETELRSITAEAADIRPDAGSAPPIHTDGIDLDADIAKVSRKHPALDIYYDGTRVQEIEIDGHVVEVSINNTGFKGNAGNNNDEGNRYRASDFVQIECPSLEAKRAVLDRLNAEASTITDRRPRIMGAMQWGSFRFVGSVPKRPISTVVLKEGQGERILDDLRDFLGREETYGMMGMPFRRGILLEGAPGTGKSSIATALAHELRRDVYIINLSAVESDNALLELVTDIRHGSILLLEDIDVANSAKERSDDRPGVTMSGILNALDGIATPQGLITILTTNNVEVIDPAILPPGRVDLHEKIGYIDDYQLRKLCETFLGFIPEDLPYVDENDKITSATVVECFKRNLDNKQAAARDLVTMIDLVTKTLTT